MQLEVPLFLSGIVAGVPYPSTRQKGGRSEGRGCLVSRGLYTHFMGAFVKKQKNKLKPEVEVAGCSL